MNSRKANKNEKQFLILVFFFGGGGINDVRIFQKLIFSANELFS